MTTTSISTASATAGPGAASSNDARRGDADAVRWWLWLVAGLVFVMVGIGGATRLTGSGLSITEWQPIMGAIPPLTDASWQAAFARYRQIPQYAQVNAGMSLAEFKAIFWWEWSHRLLGRLIGVVFALPLAWFWWRGAISRRLGGQLAGLLALGLLQGVIGWYMVQSGLVERVSVSQYRLALHLTMAIMIFGLLVWIALGLAPAGRGKAQVSSHHTRVGIALLGLVLLQIILGAFVAGLKAGLTYNTWPLMDGRFIPDGLLLMRPWFVNPFENITTVQFDHRMMAYTVLAVTGWHAWTVRRDAAGLAAAHSAAVLLGAVAAQAVLGIAALLTVVPLSLGIAHQAGAVAVFGIAVWHLHRLTHSPT